MVPKTGNPMVQYSYNQPILGSSNSSQGVPLLKETNTSVPKSNLLASQGMYGGLNNNRVSNMVPDYYNGQVPSWDDRKNVNNVYNPSPNFFPVRRPADSMYSNPQEHVIGRSDNRSQVPNRSVNNQFYNQHVS